jgi:mannan endo-1,4-beta-mannosidase
VAEVAAKGCCRLNGGKIVNQLRRISRSKVFVFTTVLLLIVAIPLCVFYGKEQIGLRQQEVSSIRSSKANVEGTMQGVSPTEERVSPTEVGGIIVAQAARVYTGVSVSSLPDNLTALQVFERDAKKKVAIVMWYQGWGVTDGKQNFQTTWMDIIRKHGSIPLITWEPWKPLSYPQGVNQPAYTLRNIINGHFDSYIIKWARASKAWGYPYFLRFAPEMNGSWSPWSEQVNGNKQGEFVQAWKHIHDIFTAIGARNVTWVWTPNVESYGTSTLVEYYPGVRYVDWVGMDGFNWGTSFGDQWQTFSQIFQRTYLDLLAITDKPVMIAETGSTEQGGNKAAWITDAYSVQIPRYFPKIKAIFWFNDISQRDWRIESSSSAQYAFAQAMQSNIYNAQVSD